MRFFSYIILLIIIAFGVTFSCLNAESVVIDYYFGSNKMPLSLLLALVFTLGVLMGLIVPFFSCLRLKAANFFLRKRVKTTEKELSTLRSTPAQDSR